MKIFSIVLKLLLLYLLTLSFNAFAVISDTRNSNEDSEDLTNYLWAFANSKGEIKYNKKLFYKKQLKSNKALSKKRSLKKRKRKVSKQIENKNKTLGKKLTKKRKVTKSKTIGKKKKGKLSYKKIRGLNGIKRKILYRNKMAIMPKNYR